MRKLLEIAILALPLAAFPAVPRERLGFDPATNASAAAAAYIAQESMILYRMRYPDGSYREFEHNFDNPNALHSVGGWRGRVKGDRITVKSGDNLAGGPAEFVFRKGRLVSFRQKGVKLDFPYDAPRPLAGTTPPYHFGDEWTNVAPAKKARGKKVRVMDAKVAKVMAGKWKNSGRLRWPYPNPNENGCIYAACALLACSLFFLRHWAFKAAGGVLFLASVFALVTTASRGSFLAFGMGLLPIIAFRFRQLVRSKAVWILASIVCVAAAGWFLTHDAKLLTRGFKGASSWSNEVRLEMWRAVPQMAVEAPGGWNFAHVGRAYMDWYQPLEMVSMPGSLMNEHLTRIAGKGWVGRFAYIFAWLAGLGLLVLAAVRTRNAVALGVWVMFAVAGWFNPVFSRNSLWVVPWVAIAVCLCGRPWRGLRVRQVVLVTVGVALLTGGVLGGIVWAGSGAPARGYPVLASDNRVYVKNVNPRIWIVDDGKALGGVLACKEIRGHYAYAPDTPAVGYVRRVEDIPENVHRLVLAGQSGDDWMRRISSDPELRRHLPAEVMFISPPFPPSALPAGLFQACKVTLVVGEFAARYEQEYDNPPEWVRIIPEMELYLPGWMALVTDG